MTSRKSNGGIVDAALAYIKRGWNPVPVGFKEKKPTGKAWQKVIITEATVGQYFNGAPQNIGVQMGANSGGLADVDLDCAEAIAAAPYIIPPTGAVFGRATKRSSHRLYKSDFKPDRAVHPFKNCDGKMMVELRIGGGAKGAQSVFPPSTHKETGEAIDSDKNGEPPTVDGATLLRKVERLAAVCLLAQTWPDKGSRHFASLTLGGILARSGISDEEIDACVAGFCAAVEDPEIEDRKKAVRDHIKWGRENDQLRGFPSLVEAVGENAAKLIAKWLSIKEAPAEATGDIIERYNSQYAIVQQDGSVSIMSEIGERPYIMSIQDFRLWCADDVIPIGIGKTVKACELWLTDKRRRRYTDIVFDPRDTDPNHYNLWRDFPIKGDATKKCPKLLAYILNVLCASDDGHFLWMLAFLAHMIQRPWEKAGVALALRGEEGSGKGFFYYEVLIKLLSRYLMAVISQTAHVSGKFNAHLQSAILVFIDEGFWAGDKQAEAALKHLVTDEWTTVEGKYKNPFLVRNLARFIIASNSDWVVPAGPKARRWAVFDVSDKHKQDRAYFAPIVEELKNGGLEAFMHLLENFDLKSVDLYTVPKTQALLEQKIKSSEPHVQWWFECLQSGEIVGNDDSSTAWPAAPDGMLKGGMWFAYRDWTALQGIRSRLIPDSHLHEWFNVKKLLPDSRTHRPRGDKRHINFAALAECRKAFEQMVEQAVGWSEVEQEVDVKAERAEIQAEEVKRHFKRGRCR